jgi:hypothetical protein
MKKQILTSSSKSAAIHVLEPSIHEDKWEDEESDAEPNDLRHRSIGAPQLFSGSDSEGDLGDAVDAPRIAQWEDDEEFEQDGIVEDSQEATGLVS